MYLKTIFLKDFYKVNHYEQYPKGTELIFTNFTPRKSLMRNVNYSIFFGLTYFIKEYLQNRFYNFFKGDYNNEEYKSFMESTLHQKNSFDHILKLRKLGYLPLRIYALPEGAVVPCGVPALVMYNTHPDFYWLPNMLETILSCTLWGACTSATIANEYRKLLDHYAKETSSDPDFVDYQAHDFSFRGMFGLEAALLSGAAHLQYFKGTDTIPAIFLQNEYYGKPLSCGTSVFATEHSVMSAGGEDGELETYRRLIEDIYPDGIISIVSDTWDLWNVIDNTLPNLKDKIMARNGKVVIRPDSGDPVKIICGDPRHGANTSRGQGLIEALWDLFGGKINNKGYKELDSHIGAIYGDSITLERARSICERLEEKGFASTNIVFGIGSFTYQYNTRDTLGWAMKSTYAEINGIGMPITKDPITDDGTKKSHCGILKVLKNSYGKYICLQNVSWEEFHESDNELKLVFRNGELI
jgi:nicotinamide phosphoribosyltransferase